MRAFRETKTLVAKIAGQDALESHEYEGMAHVVSGPVLRNMCEFLEKVVPP